MQITIDTSQKAEINWLSKDKGRIVQNVSNLLSTYKYEVAYDRTMGLTRFFVDTPLQNAIATATTEIIELINAREPRATVKGVYFTDTDINGNMQFKVVIEVE